MTPTRPIDIRPVKRLATRHLPNSSILRTVILAEDDEIEAIEFLAKLKIWLALLRSENLRQIQKPNSRPEEEGECVHRTETGDGDRREQ